MTARRPIVCGVDGSAGARRAAATARSLSAALGAPLVLVHVVPPRPPMPAASVPVGAYPVGSAAMAELDRTESEAAFAAAEDVAGADAERVTEHGQPAEQLAAVADDRDACLIVVGSRGHGAVRAALLGSVSQALAADATRPVVIVPDAGHEGPAGALGPGPVVCGVDGSEGGEAAAWTAAWMADELGAALTLVSVRAAERSRGDVAAGLAAVGPRLPIGDHVERVVLSGDPAGELARAARERRAPLIVVGTRGRGPLRAALLGSVSAAVTRRADRPVLVAPPSAGEPRERG